MLIDIEVDVMNTPEEQVEILQKNLEMFASKVEKLNYSYSEMSTRSEIGRELIQAKESLKQLNNLTMPKKEEILKWLKETHGNISNIGFKYVVRVIELTIDNPDLPLTDIYEIVSKEYGTKTNNAEKVIRTYRKKTIYADIKNKEFISLLVYDYQESKSKEA